MNSQNISFENIKLIIWDLDQTFWQGVLSEESIIINSSNIELIKRLTDCGIINSISSKNDNETVNTKMKELNISDYFVFNNINWNNKGQQIAHKISDMNLRAENVLFIDDEPRNLEEASYYCPKLMTATPDIIADLYNYAFSLEPSDSEHKRLSQYQILEKKRNDEIKSSDKIDFLRKSNITITIDHNCLPHIKRIHEMISRTNQLNFTKVRDDMEILMELLADDNIDKACIYVKDQYGDYGIAGFYCMNPFSDDLRHFLFSCRIMGMGIESYIYKKLGCPEINISQPVSSDLYSDIYPDWIKEDSITNHEVSNPAPCNDNRIRILLKGPCDMSSLESYLSGGNIFTEFNTVNNRGFITAGQNHTMHIWEYSHYNQTQLEEICSDLDFITMDDFKTSLFDREYDIIALSLLPDGHAGLYRNKNNGAYISFGSVNWDLTDPVNKEGYINGSIVNHFYPFTSSKIDSFSKNWEFVGTSKTSDIIRNLDFIYNNVPGNPQFILLLASEIEYEGDNLEFANHATRHKEINNAVIEFARDKKRIKVINPTDYIKSQDDYEDSINHYSRNVYYNIATNMVSIINERVAWLAENKNNIYQRNEKLKAEALYRQQHLPENEAVALSDSSFYSSRANALSQLNKASTASRRTIIDEYKNKYSGKKIYFILPVGMAGGGSNIILSETKALINFGVDASIVNLQEVKEDYLNNYSNFTVPVIFVDDYESVPNICADGDLICGSSWQTIYVANLQKCAEFTRTGYYIQDYEPYFYNDKNSTEYQYATNSYNYVKGMRYVTKTKWNQDQLLNNVGITANILGPSLNLDLIAAASHCQKKSSEKVIISAMVRPHSIQRSPAMTMRILEKIYWKYGNNVDIHIFGGDTEGEIADYLQYSTNFVYTDHETISPMRVSEILAMSDIFVDFSTFQAMGLTALEAMASGCAVIVPENGGCLTYANNEENSIVVNTFDEDKCLAALHMLITNKKLREKISLKAMEDAWKYFPEKCAAIFMDTMFND